jgi:DNA-binding transcriptional LysR family regulator
MNQLATMRMFTKVAEALSFSVAAKQLGVSSAVVTRGIATLEAYLNVRLLNRTTRHVSLTDAGHAYWQGCAELLNQLYLLEGNISSVTHESIGSLKIAAPESFAATDLGELVAAYHLIEPRVSFELTVIEGAQEFIVNDYDVWFSAERRLRDSSLVCRSLTPVRDVIVASPDYLTRRGPPLIPQDLSSHDVLLASDMLGRYWEFCDAHGSHRVALRPIFSSSNLVAVKRAVVAGLGIARLPRSLILSELQDGSLQPVLGGFDVEGDERTVWMLYSGKRYMTRCVRSFVDFTVARYRQPDISIHESDSHRKMRVG